MARERSATTSAYWHPTTVRYLEVDTQGVVFNMGYLAYLDEAMTGFLAASGYAYPDMIADGTDFQLVHTELDWSGPVAWGDEVAVGVGVGSLGTSSFTVEFDVVANGATACRGRTVYVAIAPRGGKQPIPAKLRAALANSMASS